MSIFTQAIKDGIKTVEEEETIRSGRKFFIKTVNEKEFGNFDHLLFNYKDNFNYSVKIDDDVNKENLDEKLIEYFKDYSTKNLIVFCKFEIPMNLFTIDETDDCLSSFRPIMYKLISGELYQKLKYNSDEKSLIEPFVDQFRLAVIQCNEQRMDDILNEDFSNISGQNLQYLRDIKLFL